MPIPLSTVHDVLVVYLKRRLRGSVVRWLAMEQVARELAPFFTARQTPGFESNTELVPRVLRLAAANLDKNLWAEYDRVRSRIRLNPLGAFLAMAHEMPSDLEELIQALENPTP